MGIETYITIAIAIKGLLISVLTFLYKINKQNKKREIRQNKLLQAIIVATIDKSANFTLYVKNNGIDSKIKDIVVKQNKKIKMDLLKAIQESEK